MNRNAIRPLLVHLRNRALAVATTPSALVTLLVFSAVSLVFWPALPAPNDPGGLEWTVHANRTELVFLNLLWIFLWPQLPTLYCRGRAVGRGGSNFWSAAAAPGLPVGTRQRAVAESLIVLCVASTIWLAGRAAIGGGLSWTILWSAVSGAVVMAPTTVAWALPSASLNASMLRPFAVAVLVVAASGCSLFSPTLIHVLCLGLCGLVLLSHHRVEQLRLEPSRRRSTAADRRRSPLPPAAQLARDTWRAPLSGWWPWIVLSLVVYVAALGSLDATGKPWEWGFFIAFELFLIINLQILLRPFDCNLAMEGLIGKHGAQRGDFLRAWAVLPVARHQILRRVWLHGMVVGGMIWAIPVGMLLLRSRLLFEQIGLKAADGGDLDELVLPSVAFVPMIAGFLVAACAGRRLETNVSGISLLFAAHGVLLVKVLLSTIFGNHSLIANGGTLAVLGLLVAIGALPPLRWLRRCAFEEAL